MLSGCFLLPQEDEYLQPPLRAPDRIEYVTFEVTRGNISDDVRGYGTVDPRSGTIISFGAISGRLKALHFHSGQNVEEGDLLAELQNDDLLEALQRQEIYTRLAEIDFERYRGYTRLDREAAQLRLDLSYLDLEKAREAVEKTRVYAPMSGNISYRVNLKIDEYIEPFLPIYTIADVSNLILRMSDDTASRVPLGAEVSFLMDSEVYYGTVVQIPSLNPGDARDKNITVIESDSLDPERIRIGARFTMVYTRASSENAIVIQNSLIRQEGNRSYVILLENNVPVERSIVIGLSTVTHSEIIEGLQEGEIIIQ